MKRRVSRRRGLNTVLGGVMALVLGACGVPTTHDSVNIYGNNTDEAKRARVDRLVNYCQKLSNSGNFYLSAGMCARAHDLDPTNPLPLLIMAENFVRYERPDDAMRAYSVAMESHPESIEAAYGLSKLQLAHGYENEALRTLQKSMKYNPNDPGLLNIVGIIKDQQGDHQIAQFYYREALAQDPKNLSVSNNLGLSLALSGQGSEAVRILNQVVADPNAPSTSQGNLALAYAAAEADAANNQEFDGAVASESSDGEKLYNESVEIEFLQESRLQRSGREDSNFFAAPPIPFAASSFAPVIEAERDYGHEQSAALPSSTGYEGVSDSFLAGLYSRLDSNH